MIVMTQKVDLLFVARCGLEASRHERGVASLEVVGLVKGIDFGPWGAFSLKTQ